MAETTSTRKNHRQRQGQTKQAKPESQPGEREAQGVLQDLGDDEDDDKVTERNPTQGRDENK